MKRCLVSLLLIASANLAFAQGDWSGKATLGYLATTGNTDNSNLNTGFELGYETSAWKHRLRLAAVNAAENDETTAEAYEAGWKSELSLSEVSYLLGRLDWRKDRFSGYNTQFSQTVGYGHRVLDTESQHLSIEVGAGARQSELADGTSEEEFIARAGLEYKWVLSDNANFTQDVSVESGGENTYIESVSKISATLVGDLALVFSYTVRNNSDVPADRVNTDTFTAVSLEYLF